MNSTNRLVESMSKADLYLSKQIREEMDRLELERGKEVRVLLETTVKMREEIFLVGYKRTDGQKVEVVRKKVDDYPTNEEIAEFLYFSKGLGVEFADVETETKLV